MRIYDKRRDYYDNIQGEPTPVWKREKRQYSLGNVDLLSADANRHFVESFRSLPDPNRMNHRVSYRFQKIVVGFCGRLYPLFYYNTHIGRPKDVISDPTASGFVKKYNDTVKYRIDRIKEEPRDRSSWWGYSFNDRGVDAWEKDFGYCNPEQFIALKSPVFLIISRGGNTDFIVNPLLIDYGFQRVIDPYTAYQTLDMFRGNEMVMAPLDDFVMDDVLKRDSKGMDEWSFKQKGPKKRKA